MKGTVIRYSEAFELQVVEEMEKGRHRTVQEVQEEYGTRGVRRCRRG